MVASRWITTPQKAACIHDAREPSDSSSEGGLAWLRPRWNIIERRAPFPARSRRRWLPDRSAPTRDGTASASGNHANLRSFYATRICTSSLALLVPWVERGSRGRVKQTTLIEATLSSLRVQDTAQSSENCVVSGQKFFQFFKFNPLNVLFYFKNVHWCV